MFLKMFNLMFSLNKCWSNFSKNMSSTFYEKYWFSFFLKNVVTFSRNVENNKQQVYMGFGGL
jgi:hypothetical protein